MRDVANSDGDAGVIADAHLVDVGQLGEGTDAANDEHLLAALDRTTRCVSAGLIEAAEDIVEYDAELSHLGRVGLDVDLLFQTTIAGDVCDARNAHERGANDPILNRAQRHGIGALAAKGVAIDFADRRCQWTQLRLHTRRKRGIGEALVDLLARRKRVNAIFKRQGHHGEPEQRSAALAIHARYAVERALDRNRDATLHLFGGLARVERNHLYLEIGWIGKRLDGEVRVRKPTDDADRDCEQEHRHAVLERFENDGLDHESSDCLKKPSSQLSS